MCLILLLSRVRADYPLIVAANREEARDRPATAPFRWDTEPPIWAGRDERAGGTWLGVNGLGLVVGLTNQPGPRDASLASRGDLCLQALKQPTPAAAMTDLGAQLASTRYNPFNLVAASATDAWAGTTDGITRRLETGPHVISNRGAPDDANLPVVRRARRLLSRIDVVTPPLDELLQLLAAFCADTGGPSPICRPGGERGTVSSSLLVLNPDGSVAAYWHANGPPNQTPYETVSVS